MIYLAEVIGWDPHPDEANGAQLAGRRPRVARCLQRATGFRRSQTRPIGQTEFQRQLDAGPRSIHFARTSDEPNRSRFAGSKIRRWDHA
jgi:hypothetical protein